MGGGILNNKLTNSNNWLETATLVNNIASQIIEFLSRIEEFQKHLWLKKKFVLSTDYCFTLDRVPEEFYPEIAQNTAQLDEWKHLYAIHEIDNTLIDTDYTEPLSVDFLKENPNLILDTCHFDSDFKDRLLANFDDLDNEIDGLLIHGENFQALNLLTEKYRESVKTIYIDPPYNTKGSDFLYKDQYKHASWLSLIADRISLTHEILSSEGAIFISIDDNEQHHLRKLMDEIFGEKNFFAILTRRAMHTVRNSSKDFNHNADYALVYAKEKSWFGEDKSRYIRYITDKSTKYPHDDNDGKGKYKLDPLSARNYYEPYTFTFENGVEWSPPSGSYPRYSQDTLRSMEREGRIDFSGNEPRAKRYLSEVQEGQPPDVFLSPEIVGFNKEGTSELRNIFGEGGVFPQPKPVKFIKFLLELLRSKDSIILDFFAGSGTTAHATINLNRQDNGNRKYILIEMGHHFDTTLIPRIKKAIYAEKWKDAKPVSRESRLSHIIKYQRIESYEDTLNNIEFTEHENTLFKEHQLNYLVGKETRESQTLLNATELQSPFNYQLNIVKNMQVHAQPVDLPETFNYLIGIHVQTQRTLHDDNRRYLIYRGTIKQKTVVIIWRETRNWTQQHYERDYQFIQHHNLTQGADKTYINTDSIVPEAEALDPLFKRLMFAET